MENNTSSELKNKLITFINDCFINDNFEYHNCGNHGNDLKKKYQIFFFEREIKNTSNSFLYDNLNKKSLMMKNEDLNVFFRYTFRHMEIIIDSNFIIKISQNAEQISTYDKEVKIRYNYFWKNIKKIITFYEYKVSYLIIFNNITIRISKLEMDEIFKNCMLGYENYNSNIEEIKFKKALMFLENKEKEVLQIQ